MGLTTYYSNAGLNYLLLNVSGASASTLYLALFTGDPTATPSLEVAPSDYARQAIAFVTPLNGETRNSADVSFGTPAEAWGTVSHYGLFDASTNGHMLFYEAFQEPVDVESGAPLIVGAGTLIVSLE